ncbi:MAG: hypothetical protein Q9187_003326 [Circinaria calcarea]
MAAHELPITLKFLKWQKLYETEKPFKIFINVPKDAQDPRDTNLVFESVNVRVHNVREHVDGFSLDNNGFMYRQHLTRLSNFTDRKSVDETYLPEMEALLKKEVDGVDQVFFFDWRLRKNAPEVEGTVVDMNDLTTWLRPAVHAHIGALSPSAIRSPCRSKLIPRRSEPRRRFEKNPAPAPGRSILPPQRSCPHHQVLSPFPLSSSPTPTDQPTFSSTNSIWRPLIPSVSDWPLALCDGSTVSPHSLVETDHVRRSYTGSTMYLMHEPQQKWYYLSGQGKAEVVIFKNFDSERRGVRARYAPHASFLHPDAKADRPPRESIEVRAFVFTYPKDMKLPDA